MNIILTAVDALTKRIYDHLDPNSDKESILLSPSEDIVEQEYSILASLE